MHEVVWSSCLSCAGSSIVHERTVSYRTVLWEVAILMPPRQVVIDYSTSRAMHVLGAWGLFSEWSGTHPWHCLFPFAFCVRPGAGEIWKYWLGRYCLCRDLIWSEERVVQISSLPCTAELSTVVLISSELPVGHEVRLLHLRHGVL